MPEHVPSQQQGPERDLARRAERLRVGGLKADTGVRAHASGMQAEVDPGSAPVVAHAPGRTPSRAPFLEVSAPGSSMCFPDRSSSFPHSL